MFNSKSIYALNKKDPNAIVYPSVDGTLCRLTREDFASEAEFLTGRGDRTGAITSRRKRIISRPTIRSPLKVFRKKSPLQFHWSSQ